MAHPPSSLKIPASLKESLLAEAKSHNVTISRYVGVIVARVPRKARLRFMAEALGREKMSEK
jgi:hypothetical protein